MNKHSLGNTDINIESNQKTENDSIDRLPFSQACENNKQPILDVLKKELQDHHQVLEIGSGTGQHSVYFAPRLQHLHWQTSDVTYSHSVIKAWHKRHPAPNLHAPLAFDLVSDAIPNSLTNKPYDAVFTANTLHIIAWPLVARLFELVGDMLPSKGKLIVYGPFNDNGSYSSDSNRQFDAHLRQRDPNSGIRHKEDIIALAEQHHLLLNHQYKKPANNEILVFVKEES